MDAKIKFYAIKSVILEYLSVQFGVLYQSKNLFEFWYFCIFHILSKISQFGLQIFKFFVKMFFVRNQILSTLEVSWGPESTRINAKNTINHQKMSYFDLFEPSDFGELNRRQHGEEGCYKWCRVDQELVHHECNES